MATSLKQTITEKKIKQTHFRSKICALMSEMLANGFALHEVVLFISKLPREQGYFGRQVLAELAKGASVPEAFAAGFFPADLLLQLQLAEVHGDLAETLGVMAATLRLQETQKKAIRKVMTYPIILFGFVMIILLVLKFFLLPQLLQSGDFGDSGALKLIEKLPEIILVGALVLLAVVAAFQRWLKTRPAFQRATFIAKVPFVGTFYKIYVTALFAREFGKLFKLGIDLRQTYQLLAAQNFQPLMKELAERGEDSAKQGHELITAIEQAPFFQSELTTIIQTGEMKGKLGDELLYYSQILWQRLVEKVEACLKLVQPLIFIGVALMIVFLYAALLLPMYGSNMEGLS